MCTTRHNQTLQSKRKNPKEKRRNEKNGEPKLDEIDCILVAVGRVYIFQTFKNVIGTHHRDGRLFAAGAIVCVRAYNNYICSKKNLETHRISVDGFFLIN